MQLTKLLFFFISILLHFTLYAQNYSIKGKVVDAKNNESQIGVSISLLNSLDSIVVKSVASDVDGNFIFTNVSEGNYVLKTAFIGAKINFKKVNITNQDVDLGNIVLQENTKILKEVKIETAQVRVEQKEDTTQYNANAYKTNPDANVEDLIKKMPGITIENGVVKAQGEEIKKVLIDGQEFFGDDAAMALKNLPAEVVEKLQVFDRQSEQSRFTGFDDGNQEKTINIITKPGKNQGKFGKLYAGYGDNNRYSAGGNLNYFKEKRRVSVIGMSNNINQQNFSAQDLTGVVGPQTNTRRGGGAMGRGGAEQENPSSNFLVGQQNGITQTTSVGINFTDNTSEKFKVNGSYFFNALQNNNTNSLSRNYFTENNDGRNYEEQNSSSQNSYNHRLNARLELNIDTNNSIIFTPKVSWQNSESKSDFTGTNFINTDSLLNNTNTLNTNSSVAYNTSLNLLLRHKFAKEGRTISLNTAFDGNNRDNNSTLNSINQYYSVNDTTIDLDQQTIQYYNANTLSATLSYTERLFKIGMFQINYNPSLSNTISDKRNNSFNAASDSYSLLDSTLSSVFNSQVLTQKGGMSFRVRDKKLGFMLGTNFQQLNLVNNQTFPFALNSDIKFNSILPMAMFNYKFSKTTNLRMFYRTNANAPSVNQLQSVVNNTNPMLLTSGNPFLKQQFSNNITLRFGKTNPEKGRSISVFGNAMLLNNYIANSTIIAQNDTVLENGITLLKGAQFSKPQNLKGFKTYRASMSYGLPVAFIKCNLSFNAGYSYTKLPSLINGITNFSLNNSISSGLVISSNISEKIDFSLSYSPSYALVKNTIIASSNNNYLVQQASVKANYIAWTKLVFSTDYSYYNYTGLSQTFNQEVMLWNAAIGYKFLKKNVAELRFSVFDILNKNTSINRIVNDTYIEDSQTQVLNRYFLVTFIYNLRSYGAAENKKE